MANKILNDDMKITVQALVPNVYYTCTATFEAFNWMEVDDTQEMTYKNDCEDVFEQYYNAYPAQVLKVMRALYDLLQSIYHLTDQQQKNLLAAYVGDRIIGETFIADNMLCEYDDCWQFANHELLQLKQLRSVDDSIFAES